MSTPAQEVPAQASAVERRFYPRISPQEPIFLKFDECEEAILLNVGENGLLISTPNELACNFVTHLVIPLNGLPSAVCVTARVVWSNETRKLAGIQLLDLSEHDRARIRMWSAHALPQSGNADMEHTRLAAASTIELAECSGADGPPESESTAESSLRLLPLAPPLVIEARAPSTVARRVAFGVIVAVVGLAACMGAAAFGAKNAPVRSFLARFVSNRSIVSAAPPQIAQTSFANPQISNRAVTNTVASSAAIEAHANPTFVAAGKPTQPSSSKPESQASRAPASPRQNLNGKPGTNSVSQEIVAASPAIPALPAANRTPPDLSAFSVAMLNPLPVPKETFPDSLPPAIRLAIVAPTGSSTTFNPAVRSPISSSTVAPAAQIGLSRQQVLDVRMPPGNRPFLFNVPGERTLVSPSVTVRMQRSVRIPASLAGWTFNRNKKVVVGDLISRVNPRPVQIPAGVDNSVRMLAIVAKDGSVKHVTPVFGSAALIPAVTKTLHEWHYQPTFVDGKPVETQSYIVIQFHQPATRSDN